MTDNLNSDRAEILTALSAAGAFCGGCGFQPGETGCADCVRVREMYADAVMPIVDRLRAENASGSCPADCPCRQIPLQARWDNTVIHPNPADTEDTETVVCCVADGGQPVAVMLDDDQREALGLALLLPDGDGDIDPQHLELARENEQLRAELAEGHYDAACTAVEERDRLRADLQRIQRWASETVHGSAAAEVLLLIRDLAAASSAASEPPCGVLNPKVAATCTEPNDHLSPIHRDAFGNTWTRRDGERALGAGQ